MLPKLIPGGLYNDPQHHQYLYLGRYRVSDTYIVPNEGSNTNYTTDHLFVKVPQQVTFTKLQNYRRFEDFMHMLIAEQPDLLKQSCPIEDMATLQSKRASFENPQTIYRYSILCNLPLQHGKRLIKLDFVESEDL